MIFTIFQCPRCLFQGPSDVETCPYCDPQPDQCRRCGLKSFLGHTFSCVNKPEGSCDGCGLSDGRHRLGCIVDAGREMGRRYEEKILEALCPVPKKL